MVGVVGCELSTMIAIDIGEVAGVTRSTSRREPSSRTLNASGPSPVMGARVALSQTLT